MISGFRREMDENCSLLGYYAVSSGNLLPTFRDKLSVETRRVKKSIKKAQNSAVLLLLFQLHRSGALINLSFFCGD